VDDGSVIESTGVPEPLACSPMLSRAAMSGNAVDGPCTAPRHCR